MAVKKIFLWII